MSKSNSGLISAATEILAAHPQAFGLTAAALGAAISEFVYDNKWLTTLTLAGAAFASARTLSSIFARATEIQQAAEAAKDAAANLAMLGIALERAEKRAAELEGGVTAAKNLLALSVEHSMHLRQEVTEVKLGIGALALVVEKNELAADAFRQLVLAAKAEADAEKAAKAAPAAPEVVTPEVTETPVVEVVTPEVTEAPAAEEKAKKVAKVAKAA